jgi:hypothetical protein
MLQLYSDGLSVAPGAAYSFNNASFAKGSSAVLSAPATISLMKRGVYLIEVDAYGGVDADGEYGIQIVQNNTPRLDAVSITTVDAAGLGAVNTKAIVVVEENDCRNNCYVSATTIQVINPADATATTEDTHINAVVTKLI